MILNSLQSFDTDLRKIQEIPVYFFSKIESSKSFNSELFPEWLTDNEGNPVIFSDRTDLRSKFLSLYDKYKAIVEVDERKKIIDAFVGTNRVLDLCNNEDDTILCTELTDLHESVRKEIDDLFLYLYKTAINHPPFNVFVNDDLTSALKRFTENNRIEICPFCGLETMLQFEGQPRLPLDHWLNKDRFPFVAVNFDNLIPIGIICNSNGVKGPKNVLKDSEQLKRVKSYYPYRNHDGIKVEVALQKKPSVKNEYGKWNLSINPNNESENDIFESWDYIFNISDRYNNYLNDYPVIRWQKDYIEFIKNEDDDLVTHAQTIDEFKENLRQWRRTFQIRKKHGSIIFRSFIDYLLNAPNHYLFGIVENFKSQQKKGLIND